MAALTLAPQRCRIGLYFHVHDHNIHAEDVISFVRALHRQLRRPIILICDRLNVHRSAVKTLLVAGSPWLHVEWLPSYAPDLNPVEALWSHTKYSDLANFLPDDVQHLETAVVESLRDQCYEHQLKRSFFQAAELAL